MDNNTVKVAYVKLENNVADILTKNLQPKLFKKHASKLVTNIRNASKPVNDVGFFVRCNTRLIGKAETWNDTDWAKEERLRDLAKPMGEIRRYISWDGYGITKWYPDFERLK